MLKSHVRPYYVVSSVLNQTYAQISYHPKCSKKPTLFKGKTFLVYYLSIYFVGNSQKLSEMDNKTKCELQTPFPLFQTAEMCLLCFLHPHTHTQHVPIKYSWKIWNKFTHFALYQCVYVGMYVYRSPFSDFVYEKGPRKWGQGKRSFREVVFSRPHEQTWLRTHRWLSCSQLWPRELRLGWKTLKRSAGTSLQALLQFIHPGTEPATHFKSSGNPRIRSEKNPLKAVGLVL